MTTATTRAREMLANITPGEWEHLIMGGEERRLVVRKNEGTRICEARLTRDAAFIAAAPELVRELCEEVERLENEILAYQFMLGNKEPKSVSENARQMLRGHGRFA